MSGAQRRGTLRRLFARPPADDGDDDTGGGVKVLDVVIAALLGVAAVATAYAAYQVELSNGDVLKNFQNGSAVFDDANQQYIEGNQQFANDSALVAQYVGADAEGRAREARAIFALMDPGVQAGVREWETSDELESPLDAESYEIPAEEEADELVKEGEALFVKANANDKVGDEFTLVTVFFAMGLFFGGVAGVARSRVMSIVMTGFTMIVLAFGLVYMAGI